MFSTLAALALVTPVVAAPTGARSPIPGELAVVSSGKLLLVAGGKPGQVVPAAGAASEPAWSPDGKWVAFFRGGSALWAARADSAGARQLSPAGADVSEFAWVPGRQGEDLAFSVSGTASYSSKILLAAPTSMKLRQLGVYPDLIGFSVAPSGDALAVSYREGPPPAPGRAPTWKGVLAVVPLAGGPGRAVYTMPEGGYVLLRPGRWPNGKGLLFWDDPAGSASIAADGLALDSLDLATGRVSTLATTLTYSNWVSWSPSDNTVALVAGGDRTIWGSGKHLVLCAMPAAHCRSVPLPSSHLMSLDPTWTASGSLVYDLAAGNASPSALAPPGLALVGNAPFAQRNVATWYAHMELYVASPSGSGGHPLVGAPAGAHDPLALPNGLLFVRGAGLWYLPAGGATPAARVAGGLGSPSQYGNYYGYVAWYQDFAWHA